MAETPRRAMKLLYLTALDRSSDQAIVSPLTRIAVGMLSRDFVVSLAVVGPINTVQMNRLRVDLGPIRVAGGFESSRADSKVPAGIRSYVLERHSSEMVNARLARAIQRKAKDFDVVVVDDLIAWSYRPAGGQHSVVYLAREVYSRHHEPRTGLFARFSGETLRDAELAVFATADYVFARPDIASQLSEIGVPMRLLKANFSRPGSGSPTFDDANFSLTADRVGYLGYLGAQQNVASLEWFLNAVWPLLCEQRPEVELHVVGAAPNEFLQLKLNQLDNVHLHWGSTDQKLLDLGCRVVVDPLLYENHVDAKLVNAMRRSLPVVTTRSATHRAHTAIEAGVNAAGSGEEMATLIDSLMSEPQRWKAVSDEGRRIAAGLLPDFEVVHAMRRALVKMSSGDTRAS